MSQKLLSLFFTALLLCAPSISFAAEGMTLSYSKTISALDSYTKLLIHGDSVGDATGKTVTANGDAAVTTAQYKFSELGRSIAFDGSGDYLSLTDSDDWNFGSGDFTIDFWVRPNDLTSGTFYNQYDNASQNCIRFYFSGTTLYFLYSTTGSNELGGTIGLHGMSTGNWYHIALVRYGNTVTAYVDGISKGTRDVTGVTLWNSTTSLYLGYSENQGVYLNGHLSQLRISKGTARWTSDFTPPTSPYDGARTVVNITGLDGDTDEVYKLYIRSISGANSNFISIRLNNDSGSNYGYQEMLGQNATASALRGTSVYCEWIFPSSYQSINDVSLAEIILYAKSGYVRSLLSKTAERISGTSITNLVCAGHSWNNTADNITQLNIFASQTNGLGVGTNIELYKKSAR